MSSPSSWFEPCITPPSASTYRKQSKTRFQNNNSHSNSDFERLLKDPLSRRLMSIIAPIPASVSTSVLSPTSSACSYLSYSTGTRTDSTNCTNHQSHSNNSNNNDANEMTLTSKWLSPYPHPSFPHRESQIDVTGIGNINGRNGGSGKNSNHNNLWEYFHFFYPRTKQELLLLNHNDQGHAANTVNATDISINASNNMIHRGSQNSHNHDSHDQNYNFDRQVQVEHNNDRHYHQHHHSLPYQQLQHNYYPTYNYHNNNSNVTSQPKSKSSQTKQSQLRKNQESGTIESIHNNTSSKDNSYKNYNQDDWGQVNGQILSYRQGIQYDDDHQQYNFHTVRTRSRKQMKPKRKNNQKGNDGKRTDIRTMMSLTSQQQQQQDDITSCTTQFQQHHEDSYTANNNNEQNNNSRNGLKWHKSPNKSKRRRTLSIGDTTQTQSDVPSLLSSKSSFVSPLPYEILRDFVETFDIKNAGSSTESLREFLRLVKLQKVICWTIIFQDILCSTPFLPSSKKYCTEKGPKCIMWNCTCDNQIRARQASAPLLGVMFVFPIDGVEKERGKEEEAHDRQMKLETFILPLAPTSDPDDGSTKDIDLGYERMAQWPFLPMQCDTNLQQRWDTFRSIITDKHITCVTFNAQVALMPYHFHCVNDCHSNSYDYLDDDTTNNVSSSSSMSSNFGYMDLILPNVWDLRLASWMLAPHSKEEDLELQKKIDGFQHLLPQESNTGTITSSSTTSSSSKQFIGLLEAKKNLEFLYIIYPIIDKLLDNHGLKTAFNEIESPVQSVLSAMECLGLGFKPSRLLKIQSNIEARIQVLNDEAQQIAMDKNFSLSSPQQVSFLLYNKMGIKASNNNNNSHEGSNHSNQNHQSTSEQVLNLIQQEAKARDGHGFRIIDILLEFRGLSKFLNTYVKPYPKLARNNHCKTVTLYNNNQSGKRSKKSKSKENSDGIKIIYPMWIQTAARTGRLSCRKPNIQQIPTDKVMGVCPRNAFVASSKEKCLFACDYSQNEVRILAHMSGDNALISLFSKPGTIDIYKQMSSVITGKSVDSISSKERSIAKQITLALIYGMGLNNVAKKLSIDKNVAQQFFNSFYGRFRGVKVWMDQIKDFARKHKYVTTITGRRRYLDNIDSNDQKLRAQAERQAVNTVIQGSAADLVKLAMLKMAARITDWRKEDVPNGGTGIPPKLLLQIHDELVFELMANEADVRKLKTTVKRCCTEECVEELQLKVPLALTCSVGASWGNMKSFE